MRAVIALLIATGCVPQACDSPAAECSRRNGQMQPVTGSCQMFHERAATQPRFCNDNDRDEQRHCFIYIERCTYRCVVREPPR